MSTSAKPDKQSLSETSPTSRPFNAASLLNRKWSVSAVIYGLSTSLTLAVLFLILFYLSDHILDDPLGGPIAGERPFDKGVFGQTIGQLTASIMDTNIHLVLGLFVIAGFALGFDKRRTNQLLLWKLIPLCLFAASSILSIFFAIKFKAGLLWQIQYDLVNVDLLQQAFKWHLYSLLAATLSCFAIVFLSLHAHPSILGDDQ